MRYLQCGAVGATILSGVALTVAPTRADIPAFSQIYLDNISTRKDDAWGNILTGRDDVYRHPNSAAASISKVNVEGSHFYTFGYGGDFATGCAIDGRFSMIQPLFKLGGKFSDAVKCSNPAKPGEVGTVKFSTSSSFRGGVLTLSSRMSRSWRIPNYDKTGVLGEDSVTMVELKIDLRGGKCRVLSAKLASQGKSVKVRHHFKTVTTGFSKNCKVHR